MAKDPELTDLVNRALIRMEMSSDGSAAGYRDKLPPKLIARIQNAPLVDEETLGMPRPISPTRLSLREIEVVLFISHGATGAQIAKELGISTETVKSHLKRAKAKLGAINTPHLVRRVFENGYIE